MPKRSSTTDEMMIVSMVMPETGLRAVVAMALAATDVKKNEKTQRQQQAKSDVRRRSASSVPKKTATASAPIDHADELCHDRDVAVGALAAGVAVTERARGDAERAADDAQRLDDAEDARGGDRADADEAHVAAEDLRRVHLRDRHGRRDRPASGRCWPIIQISGTSTRFESTPPAHEDHRRAQAHHVAEAEDEGDGVERQRPCAPGRPATAPPGRNCRFDELAPHLEGGDEEVVDAGDAPSPAAAAWPASRPSRR